MKNSALYPVNFKKLAQSSTAMLVVAILMFIIRIAIYHDEAAKEIVNGDGGLLFTATILSLIMTAALWAIFMKKKKETEKFTIVSAN